MPRMSGSLLQEHRSKPRKGGREMWCSIRELEVMKEGCHLALHIESYLRVCSFWRHPGRRICTVGFNAVSQPRVIMQRRQGMYSLIWRREIQLIIP